MGRPLTSGGETAITTVGNISGGETEDRLPAGVKPMGCCGVPTVGPRGRALGIGCDPCGRALAIGCNNPCPGSPPPALGALGDVVARFGRGTVDNAFAFTK